MLTFPVNTEATFRDLASDFMDYTIHTSQILAEGQLDQVHIVFDRYFQTSIKRQARKQRGDDATAEGNFHLKLDSRAHGNKDAFLKHSRNKEGLAR